MDDLLIRGGHVIDGTGRPGFDADVSVGAGRIVAVELRAARTARRVIEARGQVVTPGLIAIHWTPCATSSSPIEARRGS